MPEQETEKERFEREHRTLLQELTILSEEFKSLAVLKGKDCLSARDIIQDARDRLANYKDALTRAAIDESPPNLATTDGDYYIDNQGRAQETLMDALRNTRKGTIRRVPRMRQIDPLWCVRVDTDHRIATEDYLDQFRIVASEDEARAVKVLHNV